MGKFSVLILVIIVILAIAIVIIGSDFLLLWLPLEHTDQYPSKVAALFMALTALATLGVAFAAFRTIEHRNDQEKRDRKERLLKEIIEWVSDVKLKTLQADVQTSMLGRKQRFEGIFLAISDALLKAELMKLRASENSIPVEELNNVWQSAFYCSQLALRITGKKPTDEQRKRWSNNALDIVARIDQLEEQGKLTDQEIYNGQKDLLEKVSICLKKLVEVEATL